MTMAISARGAHVRLVELHGPVLSGRTTAIELRARLRDELDATGIIELDFSDVETMSPSFADELFGRFVLEVGEDRVRLTNLNPHLVAVADIVSRRGRR